MSISSRVACSFARLGALLLAGSLGPCAQALIRDGGIDPSNLGKGDWIYQLNEAVAGCSGHVPSVTNAPSLMIHLKNQGMRYIIVKAGTGAALFSTPGFSPQFTRALVNSAHAAGLWIFGYNRSYATNTVAEIAIANYVFQQGADGFVWDAEAEWESSRIGSRGPALAVAQCSQVRSKWPTKFLAYSPFAYISAHSSFPYGEFGYYCDAVFPQDYWAQFGESPAITVSKMSSQWRAWQSGLSGLWVNAIKPIVPVGQGYNGSGAVTAAQITEFVTALKTDPSPATLGGYKGVNYWVCEDHLANVWSAIRMNNIGDVVGDKPLLISTMYVGGITSSSASVTWLTDQSGDSVVEYGLDASYGNAVTNSTLVYYHSIALPKLSPCTTYHYRVKTKSTDHRVGTSGDYLFSTAATTLPDVIIESYLTGPRLSSNPPYVDSQFAGSPSACKSSAAGLVGPGAVRYAAGSAGSPPWVTIRPTLAVPGGTYDVYVTHCGISCSSDLVVTVRQLGGSGLPATTPVFQAAYANSWGLVGRLALHPGVAAPTITFGKWSGTLGANSRMYSDGYKFVQVPPLTAGPSKTNSPQRQTQSIFNR